MLREWKQKSGFAEAGRDPNGKCAMREGYSDPFKAEQLTPGPEQFGITHESAILH